MDLIKKWSLCSQISREKTGNKTILYFSHYELQLDRTYGLETEEYFYLSIWTAVSLHCGTKFDDLYVIQFKSLHYCPTSLLTIFILLVKRWYWFIES